MTRIDTNKIDVLGAIVARLRSSLSLDDRRCYECLEPLSPPNIPVGGDYFVTVCPGDGFFPEAEQVPHNFTEEWTVTVTAYSRIHLDETDHETLLFTDSTRGLFAIQHDILKSLIGQDLIVGQTSSLPGNNFLRDLISATHCTKPQYDIAKQIGWIGVEFKAVFDWHLI